MVGQMVSPGVLRHHDRYCESGGPVEDLWWTWVRTCARWEPPPVHRMYELCHPAHRSRNEGRWRALQGVAGLVAFDAMESAIESELETSALTDCDGRFSMPDSVRRSWARTLGRRISARFPRAARVGVDTLHWLGRVVQIVWMILVVGGFVLVVLYVLWALNWAPLWTRLYSECMSQQSEANTVSEIFQHRAQCGRFASQSVGKAP